MLAERASERGDECALVVGPVAMRIRHGAEHDYRGMEIEHARVARQPKDRADYPGRRWVDGRSDVVGKPPCLRLALSGSKSKHLGHAFRWPCGPTVLELDISEPLVTDRGGSVNEPRLEHNPLADDPIGQIGQLGESIVRIVAMT